MATKKNRDAEVITLGSGDLMIKEYTDTIPQHTEFTEADLLVVSRVEQRLNTKVHGMTLKMIQERLVKLSSPKKRLHLNLV